MAIPDKTDARASVEAAPALGLKDVPHAVPHIAIGALGAPIGAQHACLDDPEGVRGERDERARDAGREQVVAGAQLVGTGPPIVPARVQRDELCLDDRFAVEEECPAARVAEEVRRQSPVQAGKRLRLLQQRA